MRGPDDGPLLVFDPVAKPRRSDTESSGESSRSSSDDLFAGIRSPSGAALWLVERFRATSLIGDFNEALALVADAALELTHFDRSALFVANRASEAETSATIARVQKEAAYLLDPHSAVGVSVAGPLVGGDTPVVTLSTAHPAKFPAAVKAATGIEPALPSWLADLHEREERFTVLDNDQGEVERFISTRTRVLEEVK